MIKKVKIPDDKREKKEFIEKINEDYYIINCDIFEEMFKEIWEKKKYKNLVIVRNSYSILNHLNRLSELLLEDYIANSIFELKNAFDKEGIGPVCGNFLIGVDEGLKSRDVQILKRINTSKESHLFEIDIFKLMDETAQMIIDLKEKVDELKAVLSWFNALQERHYGSVDEL